MFYLLYQSPNLLQPHPQTCWDFHSSCPFLSVSDRFCLFFSVSVVSFGCCPLLSISVGFCRFLSVSDGFCLCLSISVNFSCFNFCPFMSVSVPFCQFMSVNVRFCAFGILLVLVQLSAHVVRFSVSKSRDCFGCIDNRRSHL